jgi:hypothetical protein
MMYNILYPHDPKLNSISIYFDACILGNRQEILPKHQA